ncbi:MAG TPA: alpha/beta fold hydrolase [Gemmatimonadaceae bacterium]|jgi:carboxylesterase|nr:alpha/beta fold hydrolase [Gemmatimonadaceae bacterium]
MVAPLVGVLAAMIGGAALRLGAARRSERAYATLRNQGADGIVPGAEGFTMRGTNGRALLLLHGSGDTPQTLRYLAERLHGVGYTVRAPLLPGHGRGLRDFARATAADYVRGVREELDALRGEFEWVGLVGLSMGGALATRLAAKELGVRVLVLLAPYLTPPPSVRVVGRTARLCELAVPYLRGRGDASVHDPVARAESLAYGMFPPRAVAALVETAVAARRALPAITVPTLVVQSREDNRIPFALAQHATATLRAPTERHWVTGCGHVITVDYCRAEVAALVLDFLARHAD